MEYKEKIAQTVPKVIIKRLSFSITSFLKNKIDIGEKNKTAREKKYTLILQREEFEL